MTFYLRVPPQDDSELMPDALVDDEVAFSHPDELLTLCADRLNGYGCSYEILDVEDAVSALAAGQTPVDITLQATGGRANRTATWPGIINAAGLEQ